MERIELTTSRLTLKPLGTIHLDTTFSYAGDHENTSMMMFLPFADIDEAERFLEGCEAQWEADRPEYLEFAICLNGVHIGAVDFDWNEDGSAEIGWILDPKYKGNGYAAEAALAMLDFMHKKLGISVVHAHCDSENVPSYKSLEKIGFIRTGMSGGRFNRNSDEERKEYSYELVIK